MVLQRQLTPLLPVTGRVLDVGCGDGLLARRISDASSGICIEGIDVLVRKDAHIPVAYFDGHKIPFENDVFDTVMFIDVLHHTENPAALLVEAIRVARQSIVIKDHTLKGLFANTTLRFMDSVGNARHGVALPFNYWSEHQWRACFEELQLHVDTWKTRLGLYPFPANCLFERSLHFVARLHTNDSVRR